MDLKENWKEAAERGEELKNAAGDAIVKTVKNAQKAAKPAEEAIAKTAKNVRKNVSAAAKPAAKAVKQAAVSAAAKQAVYIQYAGQEYPAKELLQRAKAAYRAGNKGAVKSIRLYIKPEEGKAYYVVNDTVTGDIDL